MTGLQMLLRSMGVDIKPEEITQIVQAAQVAIPAVVQKINDMDARLVRIERMLQDLIAAAPLLLEQARAGSSLSQPNGIEKGGKHGG